MPVRRLATALALALSFTAASAQTTDSPALGADGPPLAEVQGPSLRPPPAADWPLSGGLSGPVRPGTGAQAQPGAPGPQDGWLSGMASFYSQRFHGRSTASGEPYLNDGWTAAHRDLPLGTLLSVRNPANGVEVVVRVNDRGPFHSNRMLDLSMAAAQALGLVRQGVAMVVIRPLSADDADSRALGPQVPGFHVQPPSAPQALTRVGGRPRAAAKPPPRQRANAKPGARPAAETKRPPPKRPPPKPR